MNEEQQKRGIPHPPVHFFSAMAIIALDMIWGGFEGGAVASILGILALPFLSMMIFGIAFLTVAFTQYYVARDGLGASIAKGLVLGILAAVPFPIMGTAVGVPLLAWSGLKQLESGF